MVSGRNSFVFRAFKVSVSMVVFAYLFVERKLLRLLGRPVPGSCNVLYYHSIPSEHRQAFAKQVEIIVRLTKPVCADAALTPLAGVRHCAVTFDDAFEDVIENAVPELVKRKVPAVIFVTTDVLGEFANWWPESAPERNRRIATPKQLQELPVEWITVGAHTKTHPRLSRLSEADAKSEILDPRRNLAALLGYMPESFSFPYGDFNRKLIGWCQDSAYKRIFTTLPKQVFQGSEGFVIGRVSVEPTDWSLEFRLKLLGGYSWMPWAIDIKRRFRTLFLVNRSHMERLRRSRSAATS